MTIREIYKPLSMRGLRTGAICRPPTRAPARLVQVDSPAIEVMTDLRNIAPATIARNAGLHEADKIMRTWGVRLLIVVGSDCAIEGLITARDTIGEKPVNMLRERGGKHADLTVADLMVPRDLIEVLDLETVKHAEVGHIIATLKEVGRQHAMVVDRDPDGNEYICGVFSITQVARQLSMNIQIFDVARTFSQIAVHLGHQ